ncbi:MAG: NTP transferase domain-containing protein [Actinomycetota bacterium]|nr:NTP transferase domain-containing protein [Actinomycetota bacterium]
MDSLVVLAGGKGTRIESVAGGKPKLLLELQAGKSFLDYKVDEALKNRIDSVLLLLGFRSNQILEALEQRDYEIPIATLNDGPRLRGTGGALLRALPFLPSSFFLTYGDNLLEESYDSLRSVYEGAGCDASVMAVTKPVVGFDGTCNTAIDGEFVIRHKKGEPQGFDYLDYGLLLIRRKDLESTAQYIFPSESIDLSIILGHMASRGLIRCLLTQKKYMEIGTPGSLDNAIRRIDLLDL